jgi:hypothetical protein
MVTACYSVTAPKVIETTPLRMRTSVSQRHCQSDPDQLGERATAATEVAAILYDAVK